jgi:hypothetical protein
LGSKRFSSAFAPRSTYTQSSARSGPDRWNTLPVNGCEPGVHAVLQQHLRRFASDTATDTNPPSVFDRAPDRYDGLRFATGIAAAGGLSHAAQVNLGDTVFPSDPSILSPARRAKRTACYAPRCALRNRPVCDALHAAMSSGVPVTTTSPPACPPSGPKSIT